MDGINNLSLITSTGRTGTMFFEDYLTETCTKTLCLHEPPPSRIFKFLSNMIISSNSFSNLTGTLYKGFRKSILSSKSIDHYIESNNFLFGCIPSLNGKIEGIRVVHLIRHPVNYAISHMGHGFWKGYKGFTARYIPFWLENIDNPGKDPYEVLFLRWCLVNSVIAQTKETNPYLLVKFEDLFSSDNDLSSSTLNSVREFLGFSALTSEENSKWLSVPKNTSSKKKEPNRITTKYSSFLLENCTKELKEFKYSI